MTGARAHSRSFHVFVLPGAARDIPFVRSRRLYIGWARRFIGVVRNVPVIHRHVELAVVLGRSFPDLLKFRKRTGFFSISARCRGACPLDNRLAVVRHIADVKLVARSWFGTVPLRLHLGLSHRYRPECQQAECNDK